MFREYRIMQDGQAVAWASGLAEIMHYAAVYGQDGPVVIQQRGTPGGKWQVLEGASAHDEG